METPAEVTFKDIDHSDAIETRVRERVAKLEKMNPEIVRCQVWVRAPHRRHKGTEYVIDISIQMPGSTLHIDRQPGDDHAHTDVYVAIRDAFNAMERQLRRWRDQNKGRPESHTEPLQGRIASLDGYTDSGQISTTDGRLVYFHRNSVANNAYDNLNEGDTVELTVDVKDADEGPHASIVRPISTMRFVDKPD